MVNAFEAMQGHGTLFLEVSNVETHLTVTVGDTGPGIPPDLLDDLFEICFSQTGDRVGMGLGLPTARRIVERHNREIIEDSGVGVGTRFTVRLPLES